MQISLEQLLKGRRVGHDPNNGCEGEWLTFLRPYPRMLETFSHWMISWLRHCFSSLLADRFCRLSTWRKNVLLGSIPGGVTESVADYWWLYTSLQSASGKKPLSLNPITKPLAVHSYMQLTFLCTVKWGNDISWYKHVAKLPSWTDKHEHLENPGKAISIINRLQLHFSEEEIQKFI